VVRWKSTDTSEEHIAFMFRVEEYAKEETNMKELGRGVISQKMEVLTTTDVRNSNPT
jgi:hypothetical protein